MNETPPPSSAPSPLPAASSTPLEMDGAGLRALLDQVLRRLVPWLDGLPSQPSNRSRGRERMVAELRVPMPEVGGPVGPILTQLFERVLPISLNTAHPGYLAYIPGGGLVETAVADLITGVTNRFVNLWIASPGLAQLEQTVLRWFCELAGLPEGSGGILTTGGSLANLAALVTARRERLPPDFLRGTLYTSEQTHHSVKKAAVIAGFPVENVRVVAVDERFRIDVAALAQAIEADRAAGWRPFFVCGSAGTTATGAVDPLDALAALCEAQGLWFHVDAAYGGFFLLTERGRAAFAGISRADSIALDPHKGLFLPYGTGCLLVREREALRRAHAVSAGYLPSSDEEGDRWDFADHGPELSRGARGLRIWLPFQMHGAGAFRSALDEKLDLAREAAREFRQIPGVELVSEPVLSLFTFRVAPPDGVSAAAFNRAVLSRINARARVFLSGVPWGEAFLLRVCVLSFRTHRAQIQAAVEDTRAAIEEARAVFAAERLAPSDRAGGERRPPVE